MVAAFAFVIDAVVGDETHEAVRSVGARHKGED